MPTLSYFFGIQIIMYFDDHNPPHFHVRYNEFKAVFNIQTLQIIEGRLPSRVTSLVLEWAFQHRQDLMYNWNLAIQNLPLTKIEPLE